MEIDLKKQSEEIGIDKKSLQNLYSIFISSTKKDLELLSILQIDSNQDLIKHTAHHIKGAARGLDIVSIAEMALQLETGIENIASAEYGDVLRRLNEQVDALEGFLARYEKIQDNSSR